MNAKQAKKQAALLLSTAPGGANASRLLLLSQILQSHPNARLEVCQDERTGVRFGQAAKRAGRCAKIGRSTYNYQLWAVWA